MTLPDYAVDFRGFPACPCQAEWLPVYERAAQRLGLIPGALHLFQLIGGNPKSGGTHIAGGAGDWLHADGLVDLARQMGADATWRRPFNWDGDGGNEHIHSVLRGCLHNGPARYQIDAIDAGFNGLGHLGLGAPDDGPRPLSGRTWREGIAWALQQEDDMPAPKDWDADDYAALLEKLGKPLVKAIWEYAVDNAGTKAKAALQKSYKAAGKILGG